MAEFIVTKRPVKMKSELVLNLGLPEAQWLLDAAVVRSNEVQNEELLRQLWNAVNQMREIER